MKKTDKVTKIQEILDSLYPETPIPLDHSNLFTLLIAVLLSAQTTDKKVNEITPGLFALGDNPKDLGSHSVAEIEEKISKLGLYRNKAKNIHKLCAILLEKHEGKVPESFEDLEALPGVGHKTASVVMSQGFGHPAFPVDTHIHRLAYRWGLSNGKNVVQTESDLKKAFHSDTWNKLHLQIIFFGREYCPARGHVPSDCPICNWAGIKKRLDAEQKKHASKKKVSKKSKKKS